MIRLQCDPDDSKHALAKRLIAKHYPEWTAHLPAWANGPWFERGFVQKIAMASLGACLAQSSALLALTPVPMIEIDPYSDELTFSPDGRHALFLRIGWADPQMERSTVAVGAHIYQVLSVPDGKVVFEHRGDHTDEVFEYGFVPDARAIYLRSIEQTRTLRW